MSKPFGQDTAFGSMLFRVLSGYGTLNSLRAARPEVYEHLARCAKAEEETRALLTAELGPDYLIH